MMTMPAARAVSLVMRDKGYAVFDSEAKGYNLNLFGIRSENLTPNRFNDVVGAMYLFDGRWCCFMFPATTDPGLYWRKNPGRVEGTAILVPGQYRSAYKVGTHKGYNALQQRKPVQVYRDSNKDSVLDMDPDSIQEGMFGINIHRAHKDHPSKQVNKWSAGCQVLADPVQFDFLLALATMSAAAYGNNLTYTLLEETDFA